MACTTSIQTLMRRSKVMAAITIINQNKVDTAIDIHRMEVLLFKQVNKHNLTTPKDTW